MVDLTQEEESPETQQTESYLCELGWPPALIAAARETGSYVLGLRGGAMVHFSDAELLADPYFVRLHPRLNWPPAETSMLSTAPGMVFGVGLDICVGEILWAATNPYEPCEVYEADRRR